MEVLQYAAMFTTAAAFAAWVYLLLGRGTAWSGGPTLEDGPGFSPGGEGWPNVSIVVPARNESGILPHTLPSLMCQDYAGDFTVYVVDDSSTDGTRDVALALAGNQ